MARYYMHLRDGTEELLDPEGQDFPNLAAVGEAVLLTARDLLTGDVRNGVLDLRFRIDAEDDGGAIVHTLPFNHAVSIFPAIAGSPELPAA